MKKMITHCLAGPVVAQPSHAIAWESKNPEKPNKNDLEDGRFVFTVSKSM